MKWGPLSSDGAGAEFVLTRSDSENDDTDDFRVVLDAHFLDWDDIRAEGAIKLGGTRQRAKLQWKRGIGKRRHSLISITFLAIHICSKSRGKKLYNI